MRAISRTRAARQIIVWQFWLARLWAALKRWWSVHLIWHFERAAIRQLNSLSDRQLKDIGLDRSEIIGAVKTRTKRRHQFVRCY